MCRQHLQGLLRFHKPELNLSKWPLAQRTQHVQALKALAGWCSGQKLALNNNNRKKQIKEKWLWFSAGQNVRHTFLLTQTVKQHRSRSLQFQKSWSSTLHVLPREIFKNHSNTEGSSELLSPLTVSPGERWPAASLCGWTADAFRGWSNLTARSLRAPLPGIASAFTSGCQCSEGSPTQLSEQRPALRTKILGPSTDGLRGPTAGFYLLKAFRLNRVLQSILLPIQWHGVWLTTKTQMYATADVPRI